MKIYNLEGMEFGGSREFFKEEYEKYAWTNIMQPENSGQQRTNLYTEGIDKMSINPYLPQLFRDIFRGAYVPYRDAETLNMFLKEINDFSYDHSEELGNAYEYLLSIMGSQGDAGQFRTPRHIIDMIVEIVDPQKTDSILDPACGTAGFLISSYKHILEKNKDKDGNSTLSADERKRMIENFAGYDISPDMVRLSRVNMYLHKFTKPKISEYDTLSSLDKWGETYDVILANPPIMTPKGGIIPHNRYRIPARRAEVLFVDYIAEHLNPTGKAGVIVPEGIVFQSANAYKELRKYLIEDDLLYAVISLPAGVFNPYSGVKTSILLMDKTLAKQKDEILFVKINNDGYDLGAQRREIKDNDIPEVIKIIKDYQNGNDVSDNALVTIASKKDIAEQDYILVGERYKEAVVVNSKYPLVEIGEICEVISGQSPDSKYYNTEGIGTPFYQGKTEFTNKYLGKPTKWTTYVTKEAIPNDIFMSCPEGA
ncbi:MAG: N-6 DNA methylase [Clostridiaceae bacterium]|nr:N-6 DNA methylase [Clostridiaceae bacterium]